MSDASLLQARAAPTSVPSDFAPATAPAPVPAQARRTARKPAVVSEHVKLAAIQQAIEAEVIPRLVLEHGARGVACPVVPPVDPEAAIALADALLGPDPAPVVQQCIEAVTRPGGEAAGLELLTAAARQLGELWQDDRASFGGVTLATMYLQRVLHALSDATAAIPPGTRKATAMLLPVPGEQHSFGLSMLAHGFRRDGWNVLTPRADKSSDLEGLFGVVGVDMVGFSMAADMHLSRLARCIDTVRKASRNPALIVMVGGAAFLSRPELSQRIGACGTAASAQEATEQAARLLTQRRGSGVPADARVR